MKKYALILLFLFISMPYVSAMKRGRENDCIEQVRKKRKTDSYSLLMSSIRNNSPYVKTKKIVPKLSYTDINAKSRDDGLTPLHCAVDQGDPFAVALMLELGANINMCDFCSLDTPLHTVTKKLALSPNDQSLKFILKLLNSKNTITTKNFYGRTPNQFISHFVFAFTVGYY